MARVAISKLPTIQFEGKPNIMLHFEVQWSIPETLPLKPNRSRNVCLTCVFSIFNCVIFKKYFRQPSPPCLLQILKQARQAADWNKCEIMIMHDSKATFRFLKKVFAMLRDFFTTFTTFGSLWSSSTEMFLPAPAHDRERKATSLSGMFYWVAALPIVKEKFRFGAHFRLNLRKFSRTLRYWGIVNSIFSVTSPKWVDY